MTAGKVESAIAYYNHVIRVRPDFWEAWYERGIALEELGFFAEAIESYERALTYTSNKEVDVEIWHHRGNVFQYGLGDYEAAVACYDRVLQHKPDHLLALHNRGNALLYGYKQPAAAIVNYRTAIELDPNHAVTWRNYGNALVELQDYVEAIAKYDRALALQPNDQIAYQARLLAAQQGGLTLQPPTTKPIGSGSGLGGGDTLVHGEVQDSSIGASCLSDPWISQAQPLLILEDELGHREIPLIETCYTIGRDPRNDICLRSQFTSRFHAVLHRIESDTGCHYRISDGGLDGKPSTNGLLINGQRTPCHELHNGDTIVFGPKTQAIFYD